MQGLLPNAEEQLELIAMNTQLLKSVPAEEDFFFIDKYQEPGMTNLWSKIRTLIYKHACNESYSSYSSFQW